MSTEHSTPPKPKFDYPYDLEFNDPDKAYQLNVKLDAREINFIKGLRLRNSTLTITTAHLYHKLVNELQRRNITDFTSVDAFELFVTTCVLIDAGEYEQLKVDSTELAAIKCGQGAGVPSTGNADGGLPNRPSSGPVPSTSPSNVGKRTKGVRNKQ